MSKWENAVVENVAREVGNAIITETGHDDWGHISRVANNALTIGRREAADLLVVRLGALLHNVHRWKFHTGNRMAVAVSAAERILNQCGAAPSIIGQVREIVDLFVYFLPEERTRTRRSLESKVVEDADILDGLGLVGLVREAAYGGVIHRPLFPITIISTEPLTSTTSTTEHMRQKAETLRRRLLTPTGVRLGEQRFQETLKLVKRLQT